MLESLDARCEACSESLQVGADELFEFDPRCPACAGLLVLELEGPAVRPTFDYRVPYVPPPPAESRDDGAPSMVETAVAAAFAPAASAAPPPASQDTTSLIESAVSAAYARTGPAGFGSTPVPPVHDDAAPTTRFERTPTPPLDDDDEDAAEAERDDLSDSQPLDPYEAAARALDSVMTESVRKTRKARRLSSESADSAPSDVSSVSDVSSAEEELDGLVEVVQMPVGGSTGRGSRTYERDQLLARRVGEGGDPPSGTIDLDWLALIEDAPLDEDDASVSRVIITLPESAAPSEDASDDQVRQFQEAVERLEQGTSSDLTNLLTPEERARAAQDTRGWGDGEEPPETRAWPPGEADDEPPTKPGWRAEEKRDETTKPWKKETLDDKPEDDTADWDGDPDDKTVEWVRPQKKAKAADEDDGPDTRSWPDPNAADDDPPTTSAPRRPSSRSRLESTQALEVDTQALASAAQRRAYQDLYRQLYAGKNGDAPRTLMVTSPCDADGKSTVAANLALVLARQHAGGAVLIDADPLGGGLLKTFGVRARKEGLLEALQQDDEPEGYARPLKVDAPLDLVPLGIPSSDAQDLLASGRMKDFLTAVRRDYPDAVVVLDTASAFESSPPALAKEVDGVLLVVRAGATERDQVSRAVQRIGKQRILGLVLNDARGVA